jgi:hypothetical protein
MDPLNETGRHKIPWDTLVEEVLRGITRRAILYCVVSLGVYVPTSLAFLTFVPDKGIATLLVMMFFQVLADVGFCLIMYPSVGGAFKVGLAANCRMMGPMEKVEALLDRGDHPTLRKIEETALGAAADMKAIRIAIERQTKPIPVRRRPENGEESPVEEVLDGPPQR